MADDENGAWGVAILGAGAAGLCAAIAAAEAGASVLLLEKTRRPGVKILMSGGTRCNITNARGLKDMRVVTGPISPEYDPRRAGGARSIAEGFGPVGGKFLGPSLRSLSVEATVGLFEAEGVATKIEANGKIFPVSDRAVDVLEALVDRCRRVGARIQTGAPVEGLQASGPGFEVALPSGPIRARRVIVAVGGRSYPGSGTTGDGYAIAQRFGHRIIEPKPALVPIRVEADWVPTLRGLTVPDIVAAIIDGGGRALASRREALLFAHFGLTGPAALDVSRAVARSDEPGNLRVRLDFHPGVRPEALEAEIGEAARRGRVGVARLLPSSLPNRLATALVRAAGVPEDRVGPELSRDERRRLVAAAKALDLPVAGTLGFAKAEVTSGGVELSEVAPETLESRLQPGLHFAGEVLDLDGPIGGYNFQAAWSTGWLAGLSAARAITAEDGTGRTP